jgi:ferredoxin
MHDWLRGTRTDVVVRKRWNPADYQMTEGWDELGRENPPVLASEARAASVDIVEEPFPEREAREQAARCLRCNVNTVFDTSICIACNGCVDVCPHNLIKLVGLADLRRDPYLMRIAGESLDVDEEALAAFGDDELNEMGALMLKDESTCIRCAMCASRCPTQAIQMKRFDFYRECVTIHAPNPKLRVRSGSAAGGNPPT